MEERSGAAWSWRARILRRVRSITGRAMPLIGAEEAPAILDYRHPGCEAVPYRHEFLFAVSSRSLLPAVHGRVRSYLTHARAVKARITNKCPSGTS